MDAKRGWASRLSATTPALSHRGAQGWRGSDVAQPAHKLLFQAVKRHGSDEKVIRADSPLLDTARILFLLHVHSTLATSVDYGMDPIE